MAEALWVQASTVSYSADEDRRLISSIWTPGVIYGLTISAGTGLSANVSAGRAVVSDNAGGAYLCYFDSTTTISGLVASATNNLYIVVDPGTGQATIARGATPSNANVAIGNAVTSSSAVTSVNNNRAVALPPTVQATKETYGMTTLTTDANGEVVITHGLGVIPKYLQSQVSGPSYQAAPQWTTRTATTMVVQVRTTDASQIAANLQFNFYWNVKS